MTQSLRSPFLPRLRLTRTQRSPTVVWAPGPRAAALHFPLRSLPSREGPEATRGHAWEAPPGLVLLCGESGTHWRDPDVESLHQSLPCCLRLGCADLGLGTGTPAFSREAEFFSYVSLIFRNCHQINMDYFSTSVFNLIHKHSLAVRDLGHHYPSRNGCAAHHTGPGPGCCWDGAGCRCRERGPTPVLGESWKPGNHWGSSGSFSQN